jgi:cation/acetate symporter
MTVDALTVAPAARHMIPHAPIFPLENPSMLSTPIGFIGAILGTLRSKSDPAGEEKFVELQVRANTGRGAEKAVAH